MTPELASILALFRASLEARREVRTAPGIADRSIARQLACLALTSQLLDPRQSFVLMEWRRGRQRPFQRRRTDTPRVGGRLILSDEGIGNANEKHDQAQGRDVGPDRRDVVPVGKSVGIIRNPSRHSGQTEEMLGEEREA